MGGQRTFVVYFAHLDFLRQSLGFAPVTLYSRYD